MKNYIYWAIIAFVVLVLVVLADHAFIGQLAICAYALLAFWRLESSPVFRLAMVSLSVMLVAMVLGLWQVVDAFSSYAFLLFMVGVFVLGRELWRFSKDLRRQKEEDRAR